MNDLVGFLARLGALLEQERIAFMVTGSVASTTYGPPRTTQDVDLVVEARLGPLTRLARGLDARRYYISEQAVVDALAHGTPINIVDMETGWKADLMPLKDREFSRVEFNRRREVQVGAGVVMPMASPEDVILSKLEWAAMSSSERQVRDARAVMSAQAANLDWVYLEKWAGVLGVASLLGTIRPGST